MKKTLLPAALLALVLLVSCKKDETLSPVDMGYRYFPTDSGAWSVFSVDSTLYSPYYLFPVNIHCEVKQVMSTGYLDEAGQPAFRIERYVKYNDSTGWSGFPEVWTARFTSTAAIVYEANVPYVKLVFPAVKGRKWNGNAYNTGEEQDYVYTAADVAFTLGGLTFDSTLTVLQKNEITLISEDYAREVYARNTGLISRESRKLRRYSDGTIYEGYVAAFTLISTGKSLHFMKNSR